MGRDLRRRAVCGMCAVTRGTFSHPGVVFELMRLFRK